MNEITRSDGSTMLANQPQSIAVFGSEEHMNFMLTRTATIFQVPPEDMQYDDVRGSLIKAAQLCWTYGAMPGRHVHLIPFNKKEKGANGAEIWRKTYSVADSYEWRKASADIKANRDGLRYMVQTVEMTAQEVAEYITMNQKDSPAWASGPAHPNDRGFKARVLFMHEIEIIKQARAVGLKVSDYEPAWHYGFWKQNVKQKTDKNKTWWEPDNVPAGRTRDWVALKRAEKSALAEHFELQSLLGWESKSVAAKLAAVEDAVPQEITLKPSDHALMGPRATDEEMADFYDDSQPISPPPADDPDEDIGFGPPSASSGDILSQSKGAGKLTDKEKSLFEVNRLGKQIYNGNWRDFKGAEFALWASGKNTDDLKQLGITELEKIAVQLRTKVAATGK